MKIIFDQNISYRILKLLLPEYHAAEQVRMVGLERATDRESWDYAKEKGWDYLLNGHYPIKCVS